MGGIDSAQLKIENVFVAKAKLLTGLGWQSGQLQRSVKPSSERAPQVRILLPAPFDKAQGESADVAQW